MNKEDIRPATIEEFFYWINERHQIYVNRFIKKQKKPWTDDKIFQRYKFTNVFRQLDTGTIVLNNMLGKWFNNKTELKDMDVEDAIDILFNIVWYRLFNRAEHAEDIGFQSHKDYEFIRQVLLEKRKLGKKIFTSAHMTTGSGGAIQKHGKIYGHLVAPVGIAEEFGEELISYIYHNQSMRSVTKKLMELPIIGNFIAYEIACDLRFTPLLSGATDKLTWANLGGGAVRGLRRLGMPIKVESMQKLYDMALYGRAGREVLNCKAFFELREIEHSLCEFDKYMRAKTGASRPRERYDGI